MIALWVILGLIAALLTVLVVTYLTMRRGVRYVRVVQVDGRAHGVSLHFTHWFPRWRRAFGFTLGGHIWFRDAAPDDWQRASGVGSLRPYKVQREMVAHELGHLVQEIREGRVQYAARSLFELLTQWVWRRRGGEEDARRAENAISQGTYPGLDPIPWLADFPDHWQGSAP